MKILLIEDDRKLAGLIGRGLVERKHEVVTVHDGEDGLRAACAGEWDLVLLDFMLPKKNGLEFLKSYRVPDPAPVIVLTASNAIENKIDCISTGMVVKYIEKPFAFDKLIEAMDEAMQDNSGEV